MDRPARVKSPSSCITCPAQLFTLCQIKGAAVQQESDWLTKLVEQLGWQDRLSKMPNEADEGLLWHYTTIPVFREIAKHKVIHLNPLDRMNDSREGKWLSSYLAQNTLWQNGPLANTILGYQRTDTFAFSLSEANDLLSQWRAYANGGRGVAIGFEPTLLRNVFQPKETWDSLASEPELTPHTSFVKVEYVRARDMSDVVDIFVKLITQIAEDTKSDWDKTHMPEDRNYYRIGHHYHSVGRRVLRMIQHLDPLFKNAAFREEREWRMILYQGVPAIQHLHAYTSGYRCTENDIVRHYIMDVGDAMRAVTIGPLCRLNCIEMKNFLTSVDLQHCGVFSSEATLIAR